MRRLIKKSAFSIALALVTPLIFLAWLEKKLSKSETVFVGLGQLLALMPGKIGSYLRAAYYFITLDQCSWEVSIGFGSFLTHRAVSLGINVSMGSYCVIGTTAINDGVMMASRVSITSGKRQHFDDWGRLSADPIFEQVSIGRCTWIGEGAIIMADVGSHCIVSAGTVVIKATANNQLLAGNPSKVIRELTE